MLRVNRPNLLAWFNPTQSNPLPFPLPLSEFGCLPQAASVTYAGASTMAYVNLIEGRPNNGVPAVKLVSELTGTVYNTTSTVFAIPRTFNTSGNTYDTYGSLVCPAVPPGLYRWQLVYPSPALTLVSSLIEVLTQVDAIQYSIYLDVANTRILQGVRYPFLDPGSTQSLRLRARLIDTPYQVDQTTYREVTTGRIRPYHQAADRLLSFRTEPLDSIQIEALEMALLHTTIGCNGVPVSVQTHVATQPGRGSLQPVTFTLVDQSFSSPLMP
ncbi:hypothetical protein GGR92_005275 [Spirosoma lacussanchae]|uniref:hypothetical protein n=1 Tax=Spirosoma lacussanchae TaxID=1884249 RepID=UPI0011080F29|nr:hypothetical protein [Spirosoma lacussanchae]